MTVAIIPARGGSKRIPGKNIKEFAGKPMIAHSILSAQDSGCFDRVLVSTDSEEIAEIAQKYGAEVPFMRPSELSGDHTATVPVLMHALDWLCKDMAELKHACCIYATAPFLKPRFLQQAHRKLLELEPTTVFSVTSFSFTIYRALKMNSNETVSMIWPENRDVRSQDLSDAYHDAGQFYWLNIAKFRVANSLYASDSIAEILPRKYVQDIDTEEDWDCATALYNALHTDVSGTTI